MIQMNICEGIEKAKKVKAQNRYYRFKNRDKLKEYDKKRYIKMYKKDKNKILERNKKVKHLSGSVIRKGYRYITHPTHPKRTKQGYILEHRFIMEAIIGRYLEDAEVVHHIDNNKLNNIPSNLKLSTLKEHSASHYADMKIDKNGRFVSVVSRP